MVIHINNTTTVRHITEQVATIYPCLNLVCLPGVEMKPLRMDVYVFYFMRPNSFGALVIEPWNTIREVELLFMAKFGLRVQLLQRSDSHWVVPTDTSTLSLKAQNDKGCSAADHTIHPD